MKVGNLPNYIVQVFPTAGSDAEPEQLTLHEGMYTVVLNISLRIIFVPAVDHDSPLWPADRDVPEDEFTTPEQVRWYELVTGIYTVTPSTTRAGTIEQIGRLDPPSTVFYVTPEEFALFSRELAELEELTDNPGNSPTRAVVLDRAVMRFIDETILGSPFLRPHHAESVGRST